MKTNEVIEAVRVIGLTIERPAIEAWPGKEQELGVIFPSDFKELLSHFGSGSFFDRLYVFNPFADERLNWRRWAQGILDFDDGLQQDGVAEARALWPAKGGDLPWGHMDEIMLYWRTEGNPDEWKIYIYDRMEGELYSGSMSDFLFALVSGEIESDFFSAICSEDCLFRPLGQEVIE